MSELRNTWHDEVSPDAAAPCASEHAENGQHEWLPFWHRWSPEGERECIGRRCENCDAQEIA